MRWTMDIRCLVVIVAVFYSADTQNGRGPQRYDHTGRGWDIRLAVPGEPGNDYPTLGNIPRTSFSCAGKQPGYYADLETNCQAFRVCTLGSTYGFQSFLCPNGTLFNQAVFVCDWWMNVDCQKSQQMFSNKNEQFGNLRIGPQLMKDIKKMITHPMRNPYDKTIIKSNLIVMQDYKPPAGQMSPNPIALSNLEKPFGSAKGQLLFGQNGFSDNVFAASTPSSQYLPANGNTNQLTTQVEVFQQQRQNGQYNQQGQSGQYNVQQGQSGQFNVQRGQFTQQRQNGPYAQSQSGKYIQGQSGQYSQQGQNGRYVQKGTGQITQQVQTEQYQQPRQNGYATFNRAQSTQNVQLGNQISNAQPARYTLPTNTAVTSNIPANIVIQPTQSYNQANLKFGQRQISNTAKTQPYNSQNAINLQRGQFNRQSAQYTNNNIPSNSGKQTEFGISFTKQQSSNYNSNQERQPYTYNAPQSPQFSNEVIGQVGTDAKENLVSNNDVPSTVITKTLTFNRLIQEPKPSAPRSRITFKTWIVKPSKAAKLIASPTAYTYNRPTNPPTERIIAEPTPYVYNTPTAAKLISTEAEPGYSYSRPTVAIKQVVPTMSARLVQPPPRPTIANTYIPPPSAPPTQASKLYIAPTTYKPAAKFILPPSENPIILSRQYLVPNPTQQNSFQRSGQLRVAPSTPSPFYTSENTESHGNPSFSLTKQSVIKSNHNNLTFSDILTKEKLDITVNDIVSDTSKALQTASPARFGQLRQEEDTNNSVDYPDYSYLPPSTESQLTTTDSGEIITSQNPTEVSKSAKLIAPSSDLEPPLEYQVFNQNSNQLSNLPFYKEPAYPTNTIERTVSLKISIPERVASYLFKNHSDTNDERLEILNTGSSNYLVLSNNLAKSSLPNFIPLGRLISDSDKGSNVSNSQALVYSFLADSLNAAKEYGNIAQHNLAAPSPTQPQFQNINNEELAQITNQISHLTSSQYSSNNGNNFHTANLVSTTSSGPNSGQLNKGQTQSAQYNIAPAIQVTQSQYNSQYQNSNANLQSNQNQNQVYSGQLYQLPVPDVTSQIYNGPSAAKLIQPSVQQQHSEAQHLQTGGNQNNNQVHNTLNQQSSAEVEIVQSQTLPYSSSPAKLQQAPSTDQDSSQENSAKLLENFLNSENGISAQLQDKIVGTIPHPSEENKFVTYKKDQSYYLFTKIGQTAQNSNTQTNNIGTQQSAKLIQGNNNPNVVLQFIPSVSYQLDDEKEQQNILNTFQINEFGSPRDKSSQAENVQRVTNTQTSDVQVNDVNNLYAGPSSYSAPQSSVGSLDTRTVNINNRVSSRLEQLDNTNSNNNEGYSNAKPSRQFSF